MPVIVWVPEDRGFSGAAGASVVIHATLLLVRRGTATVHLAIECHDGELLDAEIHYPHTAGLLRHVQATAARVVWSWWRGSCLTALRVPRGRVCCH
jgi:hypothetical protein